MVDELRLFVALELPADVRDALAAEQEDLRSSVSSRVVRWVQTAGIHLTLKFLGETPATSVEPITAALRESAVGHGPLALTATGLGCFPSTRQPRVVWVGLDGDMDALKALQQSVERMLSPLGFRPEKRGFSPHLTLGRVRREAYSAEVRAVGQAIAAASGGFVGAWTANSISLMQSELGRGGARYTCLADVPLRGD